MKKELVIIDPVGIHARPASKIVKLAATFSQQINLIYNGHTTDAKSILGIMSLGVKANEKVEIEVIGDDEENVLNALFEGFKENGLI